MENTKIMKPVEKALKIYAGLGAAVAVFQMIGLLMYVIGEWPNIRINGIGGNVASNGLVAIAAAAVLFGVARSFVWIKIYWDGGKALALLRAADGLKNAADDLTIVLSRLSRLLIASCILDVLFLPAYFLSSSFLPFPLEGWRLGIMEAARIIFPQAFGFAALVLAFIAHQYSKLFEERARLRDEIELTI